MKRAMKDPCIRYF